MSKMKEEDSKKEVRARFKERAPRTEEMTERAEILRKSEVTFLQQCDLLQERMDGFNAEKSKIDILQKINDRRVERLKPFTSMKHIKETKALDAKKRFQQYKVKKDKEYQKIIINTDALHARYSLFQFTIKKLSLYKEFIEEVISLLPKDYIKSKKGQEIEGIMLRLNSLFITNEILFVTMEHKHQQMKGVHAVVQSLMNKRELLAMRIGADIKEIMDRKENVKEKLRASNTEYFRNYDKTREMVKVFGSMLLSLNNLTNKCISSYKSLNIKEVIHTKSPLIKRMHVEIKVDQIKDFIFNNLEILSMFPDITRNNPFIRKVIAYCDFC